MNKMIDLVIENLQTGFITVEKNTFMCNDNKAIENDECASCVFSGNCIVHLPDAPPTDLFISVKELHPEYYI